MSTATIRFNEKFVKYEGLVDGKVTTRCKTVAKVVRGLTADGVKTITSEDAKITTEIAAAVAEANKPKEVKAPKAKKVKAEKKAKVEKSAAPAAAETPAVATA
jgi:hypothetical protein